MPCAASTIHDPPPDSAGLLSQCDGVGSYRVGGPLLSRLLYSTRSPRLPSAAISATFATSRLPRLGRVRACGRPAAMVACAAGRRRAAQSANGLSSR